MEDVSKSHVLFVVVLEDSQERHLFIVLNAASGQQSAVQILEEIAMHIT